MRGDQEHVYEARFGFDRRTVAVLAAAGLFTAVLVAPGTGISPVARIAGVLLFGGGGLVMAAQSLTRKVALRIDATGVLLGGSPLRYRATTAQVPWEDITAVVLWRQRVAHGQRLPWIGLARREGAPPLPGAGQGPMGRAAAGALVPVPFDLLMASRRIGGWRLDRRRLAAALEHFAPGVPLVDRG
ncbi:hypothetical protein PV703_14095 [Streptomyces sp. ME01-24h]|nr:hypothetical protein [Streptomyces sp. ME19-03-3]MDX3354412.1 hypothetical protein [Streptomyces sp. ME01-24h]